jgi:DNA helicase-2/ATP-dependent DNA helicase PcrA
MEQSERQELNAGQAAAVGITDGPVLVVAGAGTGKTRVITERIMRLLANGVQPQTILALTFTEKAAGEMRDRLSISAAMDVNVHTFNGFGQELLERYGPEWGLSDLRLLGEVGELVFVRDHFDEFALDYFAPLSNPTGQLKTLCKYVSALKQELILPETYARYAAGLPTADEAEKLEKQKQREIADFYTKHLELTRAHRVITYDDQIFLTIQMLEARANILREIQEHYAYVLIDEFQDTNTMQSRLIDLVAAGHKNLMVVGDDDQAIYGWRGATLANILDFTKRYPTAKDITLIENYRSTQSILDSAYRLIQHNNPDRLEVTNKLDKRLVAKRGNGPAPAVRHFYTQAAELTWVAEDIAVRVQNGADAGDIAVLARSNNTLAKVHQVLELHGVEHVVVGVQDDLYKQPAVAQLIELMSAVSDPQNSSALFYALSGPAFALPQAELSQLSAAAKYDHTTLAEAITASDNEACKAALGQIETWRAHHADVSVRQLAYDIITDSGWKTRLYDQADDSAAVLQAQALSEFFKTLQEFERIALVPSVRTYLENVETLRSGGEAFDGTLDISSSLVNVMSVHKSKGLEWGTVYIVDCTDGSFPSTHGQAQGLQVPAGLITRRSAADERMAEERRAMYVAVTRARDELILTYGDKVRSDGGTHRKPSRFLTEMFGDTPAQTIEHADQVNLELFASNEVYETSVPDKILQNGVYTLSASQIACYLKCPRDFYYKHILNIPEPPSPAAGYGTAIHAGIQFISEQRLKGTTPSYEEMLAIVQPRLPRHGFASEAVKQRTHAHALEATRRIYDRFVSEVLPIEVEKPFNVAIPDLPVRIKGRMDAVYAHSKGVEIRDYKTSQAVLSDKKAKEKASSSQQLTVYALAWQLMHDELPAALTLDYVETGHMGSVKRLPASLETLKKNLGKMVESMQTGVYPLGSSHDYCSHPSIA